jgi:hypothetical protein
MVVDQDQGEWKMLIGAEVTVQAMAFIVRVVPVRTNIGLVWIQWVMVNVSFTSSCPSSSIISVS